MTRFLPVLFAVIVLGTVGVMDYVLQGSQSKVAEAAGAGPSEGYFASVVRRLRETVGVGEEQGPDLAALLPPPPEGWTRRAYLPADGTVVTGEDGQPAVAPVSTTQELLGRFSTPPRAGHLSVVSYVRGDRIIAVRISFTPAGELETPQGVGPAEPAANNRGRIGYDENTYAAVHGALFTEHAPARKDAKTGVVTVTSYRLIGGRIGPQWRYDIMTNAGNRALMAVVGGIDTVAMNAAMEEPLDIIGPSRPVMMGPRYRGLRYPEEAAKIDDALRRSPEEGPGLLRQGGGTGELLLPAASAVALSEAPRPRVGRPVDRVCVTRGGKRRCPKK